jgi:hypothetical protein
MAGIAMGDRPPDEAIRRGLMASQAMKCQREPLLRAFDELGSFRAEHAGQHLNRFAEAFLRFGVK